MEETSINDLYLKYTEAIGESLEDDRYFQYLFEIVQAGNNTIEQKNRVLHKVVDEQWLTVIEEGITAIFNIVDKPRRFIATSEEVVPVALAKKITADSVRHLSQNTQFVNVNAQGEIQPTHILNVTTEESFDLYENRFVYHLIQRLFAFVDKRTDVIFWSTGDETCNVFNMESKIDDAYEEISYKVEMTIKNRQSLVENDTDNMDLFKRIDRVRRLSRTLRTSSFCDIMNGCAKVRSPIQRTNLMMKDPDYRTCYQLWQFIESYDEVGYSIEEQDTAMEFDEEYLLQMYINLINNYTVFKSLLEDSRNLTELAKEKREPIKPKFIKEIKEEIVDSPDIPEVEVRKVFVEEVTQAQLDAEAKLEEQTARCEELEQSLSDMQWQMESLSGQMDFLEQMKAQTEDELNQVQDELEGERQIRQQKEAEANEEKKVREEIARELEETKAKTIEELEETKAKAKKELEETKSQAEQLLNQTKADSNHEIKKVKSQAEKIESQLRKELKEMKEKSRQELKETKDRAKRETKAIKEQAVKETEVAREQAKQEVETAKEQAKQEALLAKAQAREEIEQARKEMEEAKKKLEEAQKLLEQANLAKEKALQKAKESSLSHYIVQRLKERKEPKKEDEE